MLKLYITDWYQLVYLEY